MNALISGRRLAVAATCGLLALLGAAQPFAAPRVDPWPFLPNDDIGARDFKAAHPTYDGRGIVIAILDTGVDAFAPGLTALPDGGIKLIEARDFSTEGDWQVEEAELDSTSAPGAPILEHPDGLRLRGAGALSVPPAVDDLTLHPVYIGVISEARFVNSIGDLDDDGDETDRFGFICYTAPRPQVEAALGVGRGYELLESLNEKARSTVARERLSEKVWLVVVDTDGDGDLAGEPILRDYHVNDDTFRLVSPDAPEARTVMAWSVNVVENEDQAGAPEPPTVAFHFDDGSHGSHCAGIAAGYRIDGQQGLDGVAPGAWLMSLKLGDNRLSGGATRTGSMKKSYEYAAEFGEEYGLLVVINMSFGIASVEEGDDAMGKWLDDFLAEHPHVYACLSAGNEGPGLSTIGLPATSPSVISSGAYLSVATGKSLYNTDMARPNLFTFSSRGGETAKPDVVTPGSALSTVPGYVEGMARFQGTSMASPQTAGAVACLLSGALQEGLQTHWGMVKRAVIAGAVRVPGLELFDQGGGLLNLENSWKLLQQLAASRSAHQLLWYRIETACPFQADGLSEAAYWRAPGGAPLKPETVTFTVYPIFHPDLTPDEKNDFFRSFTFQSEADWIEVVPRKRYIRGDMGMDIDLLYDGRKLAGTGVRAARVIASLDSGDLNGLAAREFYLWNMVVKGERFGPAGDQVLSWPGKDLPQAGIDRHFVEVPAGASALRVRLEVSPTLGSSKGARVRPVICDPEGHEHGGYVGYATLEGDRVKNLTVLGDELYPGIWEIDVAASRTAQDLSSYRLSAAVDGYTCAPDTITKLPREAAGQPAQGGLTVTRAFPGIFRGEVQAALDGFRKEHTVKIEDSDTWRSTFTLDGTTPRASFHLKMDEATGNLFTDCSVNILDPDGKAVVASSFDGLEADVGIALPAGSDKATYTLEVVGAFALKQAMAAWGFDAAEEYDFARPVSGIVKRSGGGPVRLYCGVPAALEVEFAEDWPAPPEGLQPFGTVRFLDSDPRDKLPGDQGGRLVLEVPIVLE